MSIAREEVMHIAAEAALDVRTVKRILSGQRPRSTATKKALALALVARGHIALANELSKEGRIATSQADPSWGAVGRPYPDSQQPKGT